MIKVSTKNTTMAILVTTPAKSGMLCRGLAEPTPRSLCGRVRCSPRVAVNLRIVQLPLDYTATPRQTEPRFLGRHCGLSGCRRVPLRQVQRHMQTKSVPVFRVGIREQRCVGSGIRLRCPHFDTTRSHSTAASHVTVRLCRFHRAFCVHQFTNLTASLSTLTVRCRQTLARLATNAVASKPS